MEAAGREGARAGEGVVADGEVAMWELVVEVVAVGIIGSRAVAGIIISGSAVVDAVGTTTTRTRTTTMWARVVAVGRRVSGRM